MQTTQQDKTVSSNMQTTQLMTDAAVEDKTVSGKVKCARLKLAL